MNFVSLVFANLGRNKVRTTLTTLSVFVALFLFCSLRGIPIPQSRTSIMAQRRFLRSVTSIRRSSPPYL